MGGKRWYVYQTVTARDRAAPTACSASPDLRDREELRSEDCFRAGTAALASSMAWETERSEERFTLVATQDASHGYSSRGRRYGGGFTRLAKARVASLG